MDEKTKQKLLEELRKDYVVTLKPIKEAKFTVSDILEKYYKQIFEKTGIHDDYQSRATIGNAIRKVLCLNYGVSNIQDVPVGERQCFRKDLEAFIQDFILFDPEEE